MMNDNWFSIETAHKDEEGSISGYARADVASPWFSGHFPGEPILPGIGQISLIFEVLKRYCSFNEIIRISEVSRLRFRRIIRPEEQLFFEIKPDLRIAGAYRFKIMVNNELASNGNLTVSEQT